MMRLRSITNGWTMDSRKDYLAWFNKDRSHIQHRDHILQYFKDVDRDYSDGSSFPSFIDHFRKEFIANLSDNERDELADYLPKEEKPVEPAVSHKFVKEWQMADLENELDKAKTQRSFTRGKAEFAQAQCINCHRFGNSGGSVGPELAGVASRLAPRDILESILKPSKVVSEQYQNTVLSLADGDSVSGRVLEENDQKLVVSTDPMHPNRVEINKSEIISRKPSKISPMPEGLVNSLDEDEIWDLVAYLESGGKKSYAAYKK
jgi:hypothetical protein